MMLQALIEYAEREGLGDLDFEPIGVRWLIDITSDGKLRGQPICLDEAITGRKGTRPKRVVRPRSDPDFVAHGRSYFLCDTLERSALWVADETKLAARRMNQAYFLSLLAEAASGCPVNCDKLRALSQFLSDQDELERLHGILKTSKAKTSDNALYAIEGTVLVQTEEFRGWWRARNATASANAEGTNAMCLATGTVGPICRTFGFIKLQGENTKLVSFNDECKSFSSFGLTKGENAPVSITAEEKCRAALNHLIEKSKNDNLVFTNTTYVHWTKNEMAEPDPMDHIAMPPDPEAVEKLIHSVKNGSAYIGMEDELYYCMSVSKNTSRLVVRDWLELTVKDVVTNIAAWFEDLRIILPDGLGTMSGFKFWRLLGSMVRDDRMGDKKLHEQIKKLAPLIPDLLLKCALGGGPLPQTVLAAALRRQFLEFRKPGDKFDPKLNPARMALIKCYLIRSPNRKPTDTMTTELDPNSKDVAYRCGQLFAVIGRLQLLALGKVGASIADRTYGGVATHPATSLGPIFTKLAPYFKKANSRFPGSGTNKQKEIEVLATAIEQLGGLPKILFLEEQGRFALGYYCQLAQYRADKAEADAAKAAEELVAEEA